ncbi:glycosyltransferase family 2 protein [Streptomyces platensis]|uniref:glycosyltransferase family 2 protein n=1 Tax=Streptomyces platensis TaxID=58346 RepID=UPI003679C274
MMEAATSSRTLEGLRAACADETGELAEDLHIIVNVPEPLTDVPVRAEWHELKHTYRESGRSPLTAVVLTRDEEQMISGTVAALAADADRILIIDSGSTDRTVELARAAADGLIQLDIVHRPWQDDFAAQRNHAFEHVGEGWLLFVDADERLTGEDSGRIRRAVRAVDHVCPGADLVLSPRVADSGGGDVYRGLHRLLRADSALRFRGRVHEQLFHADGTAPSTVDLDVEFTHSGYEPEVIERKGKKARDGRLIDLCRREEPGNPTWAFYAAREVVADRMVTAPAAAETFDDLVAAVSAYGREGATDYERQRRDEAFALLGELAFRTGDPERIERCLAALNAFGRTVEQTYFATLLESSRLVARLSQLVDLLDAEAEHRPRPGSRSAGQYAELRGLLALSCGRYDEVPDDYAQAVRLGTSESLARGLTDLRLMLARISPSGRSVHDPLPQHAPPRRSPAP